MEPTPASTENQNTPIMEAAAAPVAPSDSQATVRSPSASPEELTGWLIVQLAKAEAALYSREQMEKTWNEGTNEEWNASAQLHPSTAGKPPMTKAARLDESERQGRIAAKCRHDVAMFKQSIERVRELAQLRTETVTPDGASGASPETPERAGMVQASGEPQDSRKVVEELAHTLCDALAGDFPVIDSMEAIQAWLTRHGFVWRDTAILLQMAVEAQCKETARMKEQRDLLRSEANAERAIALKFGYDGTDSGTPCFYLADLYTDSQKELAAVRQCFAEASHDAGPAFVAHTALAASQEEVRVLREALEAIAIYKTVNPVTNELRPTSEASLALAALSASNAVDTQGHLAGRSEPQRTTEAVSTSSQPKNTP